ncbi:neutral/alkaline non-lysosomal ceramidase [Colletotrichum tofieldiae]|nr:neutral/alkaline non-lysosomal ceramidase [Colletotrichum tofieldiae]
MPSRRSAEKSPASAAAAQTASPPSSRRALVCLAGFVLSLLVVYGLYTPSRTFYDTGKWFPGTPNIIADIDADNDLYLIGSGRADVTGPVVEINMMGYADPKQLGTGLRQRLYARAFIVGSVERRDDRFIYVVLDTQSGDTAVRYGVLHGLAELGSDYSMYGHHNLALTGTHSHSGPGAWLNYLLPQITSKGFDKQSYQAIVDGTLLAIRRAHESLEPGHISIGSTKVTGANINRSLYAYMANPEEERAKYNISAKEDGSVEKDMTLLKFQRASDGKSIGVLTWFPTHGTSMLGNNTLISGDNKGVAAWLFEKSVRGEPHATEGFVAGFSQANMGDVSPNVLGAFCEDDSGDPCDFKTSTCSDGKSQKCHARGPFFRKKDNGAASCFEIGKRQYTAAKKLFDDMGSSAQRVRGSWVRSFHTFHDMSEFQFELPNGTEVRTCPAALGYSFAAGTSDGPGAFDFTQHDSNSSNTSPLWKVVGGLLKAPTQDQIACHSPKPILLDVGEVFNPYQWTPNVVDIQAFRVGQLVIIVSPGEASTMAGRRWKDAVRHKAESLFAEEVDAKPVVVIGGPANSYTHYITTQQEYGIQRYEGASTLYGPYTLDAYINRTLEYLPTLMRDGTPVFRSFGDVKTDVEKKYTVGDIQNYAAVEKLVIDKGAIKKWEIVRDDNDWSLIFNWKRTSNVLATSEVEIVWETENDGEPGTYRFRYYGDSKSLGGKITSFEGVSGQFKLH